MTLLVIAVVELDFIEKTSHNVEGPGEGHRVS